MDGHRRLAGAVVLTVVIAADALGSLAIIVVEERRLGQRDLLERAERVERRVVGGEVGLVPRARVGFHFTFAAARWRRRAATAAMRRAVLLRRDDADEACLEQRLLATQLWCLSNSAVPSRACS